MNLVRNILRGVLLLLIVLIFIYLNVETKDSIDKIIEFEFKFHDNVKTDSLDVKYKFDLLSSRATEVTGHIFENTSHVRETLNYLAGIIALLIVGEFGFSVVEKRKHKIGKE